MVGRAAQQVAAQVTDVVIVAAVMFLQLNDLLQLLNFHVLVIDHPHQVLLLILFQSYLLEQLFLHLLQFLVDVLGLL